MDGWKQSREEAEAMDQKRAEEYREWAESLEGRIELKRRVSELFPMLLLCVQLARCFKREKKH